MKSVFSSRKIKISLFFLGILAILLIGNLLGLIISGFFGSLESPSPRAVNLLQKIGVTPALDEIVRANVKIPFNYLSGQLSNPEKITIDINFENYQKILFKREQFLDKQFFFSSSEDFVPAKIRYGDREVNVELRLKGDSPEHLLGDKWSMRIKVKGGDTLFGMKTFSIQNPRTRQYVNEFIFHGALKREGVLSLRYDFIEVVINGENRGIYAIEEHFDKQLIESNDRREGVIVKFNEEDWFKKLAQIEDKSYLEKIDEAELKAELEKEYVGTAFFDSNVDTFRKKTTLEDPLLSVQFNTAANLLDSFRNGNLKTHEVFDVDKLAKYYAIISLLGAEHGGEWNNIRFYYNPITSLLEPIGFDANSGKSVLRILDQYFPSCIEFSEFQKPQCGSTKDNYYDLIFSDSVFFEKYIKELERVSQKEYLDALLNDLDSEIKKKVKIIHKDTPYYLFSKEVFYSNQEYLRDLLNPFEKSIIGNYQGVINGGRNIVLYVGNVDSLPIEILGVSYNDILLFELDGQRQLLQPGPDSGPVSYEKINFLIPSDFKWNDEFATGLNIEYVYLGSEKIRKEIVLPWPYVEEDFIENDFIRRESNLEEYDFLIIDEFRKRIIIKEGDWILNEDLILPSGYTVVARAGTKLDLVGGAMILSYSSLDFVGSEDDFIKVISSDGTGEGLVVLNVKEDSNLNNVLFDSLLNPSKNNWILTGSVNFYESPAFIDGVIFSNSKSEDSLNIISSKFEIRDSVFENSFSDCLDVDFGEGLIESTSFDNCGNDGIDLSGSEVNIREVSVNNVGDKGISIGEKSDVVAMKIDVNGSYICVASKDQSNLEIEGIKLSGCEYGFAIYQKKSEFGPAFIGASGLEILDVDNNYIIEKGSSLLVDGKIILMGQDKVYEKLYTGEI